MTTNWPPKRTMGHMWLSKLAATPPHYLLSLQKLFFFFAALFQLQSGTVQQADQKVPCTHLLSLCFEPAEAVGCNIITSPSIPGWHNQKSHKDHNLLSALA